MPNAFVTTADRAVDSIRPAGFGPKTGCINPLFCPSSVIKLVQTGAKY
jgi:hypothetical protein